MIDARVTMAFLYFIHEYDVSKVILHLACQYGTIEVVECLIKHGAQMETQDKVSDEW